MWKKSPLVRSLIAAIFLTIDLEFEVNAQDVDTELQIVAVQVRKQGYRCSEPQSAEKQIDSWSTSSRVWVLTCKKSKYRVTIKPNRAAVVEVIEYGIHPSHVAQEWTAETGEQENNETF